IIERRFWLITYSPRLSSRQAGMPGKPQSLSHKAKRRETQCSLSQCKGDQGRAGDLLPRQLLQEGRFDLLRIEFHGAPRDFLLRRTGKAQVTEPHRAARSDGGPERSAGKRPRFVEI